MVDYSRILRLSILQLRKKYVGTSVGLLWTFVLPAIQSIYYIFIFGYVFRQRVLNDGLPYIPWFLSGFSVWIFFSETIMSSLNLLKSNASLITNFRIDQRHLYVASIVSIFPTFIVMVVATFALGFDQISSHLLPFIFSILGLYLLFLICLLCSLVMGLIGLLLPDIAIIFPVLLQLGLFTTYAVVPASTFPSFYNNILILNPLNVCIALFRGLLSSPIPSSQIFLLFIYLPIFQFLVFWSWKRYKLFSTSIASRL